MTRLLDEAVAKVRRLSDEEQDYAALRLNSWLTWNSFASKSKMGFYI
jgi:hypothetical protein